LGCDALLYELDADSLDLTPDGDFKIQGGSPDFALVAQGGTLTAAAPPRSLIRREGLTRRPGWQTSVTSTPRISQRPPARRWAPPG
jgi:hypothetical protein